MTQRLPSGTDLRRLCRPLVAAWDARYRRVHRLIPITPLLHVGRGRYRGAVKTFADGTTLRSGDLYGELHLDSALIYSLHSDRVRAELRFAQQLRRSLECLAAQLGSPALGLNDVQVFLGITHLAPHGERVGIVSEPVRSRVAAWRLRWHFRVLSWVYEARRADPITPRRFWLSRAALLAHFKR